MSLCASRGGPPPHLANLLRRWRPTESDQMEEEQPILKSNESPLLLHERAPDEHVHHNPFSSADDPPPPPSSAGAAPPDDQLSVSTKALLLLNSTNTTGVEHLEGATDASPTCSTVSFTPGSLNREIVLAKLNQEKVLSLIKAWEDNVKAKSLHRFGKKLAKISAWEKAKKARAEAHLQALEEKLEKKKAAFVEGVQNEIATVHMKAEEQRALAEAHHGEETLKAEEVAAKYRASGKFPKKYALCFSV